MTAPIAAFALLGADGVPLAGHEPGREFYAASTIKLAVAAALLLAVDAGALSLAQTVPSRSVFSSRIPGAPDFAFDWDEVDPGFPVPGTPVSLGWCLERMLVVSSNEATNLLVETLGLDAVRVACEQLGVPGARMTRLIGDYAAREAGYTHAASALDLARLMYAVTAGPCLSEASRAHLIGVLRAQRFPMIADALPAGSPWASKSGWVDAIRHDVAAIGTPGADDFRVLAICTEGFEAQGAQALIRAIAGALFPAR